MNAAGSNNAETDASSSQGPAVRESKAPWFDAACAILMAAASLGTAWCTYQNSRWSGQTATLQAQAESSEREAMMMTLESRQFEMAHLLLASKAIDALVERDEKRAAFYTSRFTGELKPAWDKWMALKPFENPEAPPHPFVEGFYKSRFADEIQEKQKVAGKAGAESKITNHNAGGYLGNTVILATVLFFAGTAGKFDQRRVRQPSLVFAAGLFVFAAMRMFVLPIR